MNLPLLSVGMPVYNSEDCIGRAIESLLEQAYPNLEIVISDNCSTDKTREICLKYAAADNRIRYHRNMIDIGKEPNFLRVLELATGEYFLWNCGDDDRPAGSLEALMKAMLRSPQAVMAHGPVIAKAIRSTTILPNRMDLMTQDPSGRVKRYVGNVEHNAIQYALYKTSALKRAFLTTDFMRNQYGHDFLLCMQMCLLGPVEYSPAPMIVYWEKGMHPTQNPMGKGRAVTLWNLLTVGEAVGKVWITLLSGCYYLLRPYEVRLSIRIKSLIAFVGAFVRRYSRRLLNDAILIAAFPLRRLVAWTWPLARRLPLLLTLGHKLKVRDSL